MIRSQIPNLKNLLHKKVEVCVKLKRRYVGVLLGYDAFMNLVLADITFPEKKSMMIVRGEFIELITEG